MILAHFRGKRQNDTVDRLYGAIVAQARCPAFYADYGVPDTVEGRLDMIMLHVVLLLRRLNGEDEELRGLGQTLFDRFCRDMDDNLREMGIGDLTVPKMMQRIAGAFYGRAKAYHEALVAAEVDRLVEVIRRNIYGERPAGNQQAERLAAYARSVVAELTEQSRSDFLVGRLTFPQPSAARVAANA